MTITLLSKHQIAVLGGYYKLFDNILKVGLVKETGDVIIEFAGSCSEPKTASILKINPESQNTTDAEFEIIQPKQLIWISLKN